MYITVNIGPIILWSDSKDDDRPTTNKQRNESKKLASRLGDLVSTCERSPRRDHSNHLLRYDTASMILINKDIQQTHG